MDRATAVRSSWVAVALGIMIPISSARPVAVNGASTDLVGLMRKRPVLEAEGFPLPAEYGLKG
jgi:hypothetical protein